MNDEMLLEFMNRAIDASYNSTCWKRETGAVVVVEEKVVGSGHNGAPRTVLHSKGVGEKAFGKCYYENLALDKAKKLNISTKGEQYKTIKKEFKLFCLSSCAERLAIAEATKSCGSLKGAMLFCTTFPCPSCAKSIRDHGLTMVFYINGYNNKSVLSSDTDRIFSEARITVQHVPVLGKQGDQGKRLNYKHPESKKYYI